MEQTIRLPSSQLESVREWAVEGSGVAASARVRDSSGRIALIQNRWTDGWFLPGGEVEVGECPEATAKREVREEIGLDATIESPLVVLDQTYVSEDERQGEGEGEGEGEDRFSAVFVVYAASATGEIPDVSKLGVTDDEIRSARWFDSLPDDLHDGKLLRPYL